MDDFFNQFRQNLEHRPEPKMEPADWASFEKRLDPMAKKRRILPVFWWLFAPVLLGSLAANGWLFREIRQLKTAVSTVEIRRDTVILTRLVYRTDTVFETRLVYRTVDEKAFSNASKSPKSIVFEQKKADLAAFFPVFETQKAQPISSTDLFSTKKTAAETSIFENKKAAPSDSASLFSTKKTVAETSVFENQKVAATDSATLFLAKKTAAEKLVFENEKAAQLDSATLFSTKKLASEKPIFEKEKVEPSDSATLFSAKKMIEKKARKSLAEHFAELRPTSFEAGFSAGTTAPFGGPAVWRPGPAANFLAQIGFSERLRMLVTGGFSKPKFESKKFYKALVIPKVDPPTDDFEIVSIEGKPPSLHFSTEMQWVFRPQKRWKPTVGLGLGAAKRLAFQASFDFYNPATGTEFIAEPNVGADDSAVVFGLLSVGAERVFSKKWSSFGRAAWQFQPENSDSKRPNELDFQAGFRFRF